MRRVASAGRHHADQVKVIKLIFIYIRLLSVKGCHSKGALVTIQTQFKGLTRSVGKDGCRGGGDSMKSPTYRTIYTQKTSWRDLRNPMLYIVIIASYGRATATPVARIILLCTCCHRMGFVVVHSWSERQLLRLPSIVKTGSW